MRLAVLRGMIDNSYESLKRKTSAMTSSNAAPSAKAVSQVIIDMGINEESDPTREELFKFVERLSPESLRLLDHELNQVHAERVQNLVTDLVYDDRSSHHVRENKLREYLLLIEDTEREDLSMNLALIEGLHCMPLLEQHPDMSSGSREHVARCKALIQVARAVVAIKEERGVSIHDQQGVVFLTDPQLIHLVLDHPDRAEQIASFIAERQEVDYDSIAEMVKITPPLAPGTL